MTSQGLSSETDNLHLSLSMINAAHETTFIINFFGDMLTKLVT